MQFTFKHTNFNVLDLQRSMDFYQEALGLTEVRRIENPDFTIVYLGDGVTDLAGIDLAQRSQAAVQPR